MKILKWIANNSLFLLSLFLLIFIPLYPKLPVIGVAHTWVYIRLEDFIVAFALIVWLIYLIRKKVSLKTPLTIPILIFWAAGTISTVFAIYFIFPHLANVFTNVAFFNLARRFEYLSLFFVGFFAIKDKKQIPAVVWVLSITLILVVLYGMGQRYFSFPAFLTMNEEFAKGVPLRLSPLARIPSTFAGHYDLAAYLVLMIPILGSMVFGFKKFYVKILLILASVSGLILLFMTASRVSFMVYLAAITFMLIIQKQKKYIIPVIIGSIILMNFFQGISSRFASTISQVDLVVDARTGKPVGIAKETTGTTKKKVVIEDKQSTGEDLPQGTGFINLPSSATSEDVTQVVYKRTKIKAGEESTDITNMEGDFVVKKALAYDVSFTTRFQGEWPRAVDAFNRNRLLGSGYSSISLATDNNYLRMLGEVGVLGLASFLLIFVIFAIYVKNALPYVSSPAVKSFVLGVAAGIFGLSLNATLIDVFEASKVAFVLWLLVGVTLGVLHLYNKQKIGYLSELKKMIISAPAFIFYFAILTFGIYSMILNNFFIADDFVWLKWAADCKKVLYSSGLTKCEPLSATLFNYFFNSDGFFYRPGTKVYFYFMYGFFWLTPLAYHMVSILLHFLVSAMVFIISRKFFSKLFSVILTLFFVILSVHSETIFWISATGHLFSAFFIILGLVLFIYGREQKNIGYLALSFLSTLAAPLFYEMGIIAPILIIFYGLINTKTDFKHRAKNLYYLIYLIQIPAYLLIRYNSNSHWFNGDYNYNLAKLPFNFFGNLIGYFGLSLIGPKWLPFYESIRSYGRYNTLVIAGLIALIILIVIISFKYLIKKLNKLDLRIILTSLVFLIVGLLPFLGLGNIALRYDYIGSIGALILFVFVINKAFLLVDKFNKYLAILLLFLVTFTFSFYHIAELKRINSEWNNAGEVPRNLMIAFNDTFVKTKAVTHNPVFYFVDTPVKKGDAWIFPQGLPEALWFTIQNANYLTVHQASSLDMAFSYAEGSTSARVFQFDENGNVEEVRKIEKKIEID